MAVHHDDGTPVTMRVTSTQAHMTPFQKLKQRNAHVLLVCIGNAAPSQMAAGFANAHGADGLDADSAGIRPANRISRTMQELMQEKQIEIRGNEPRRLDALDLI